MSTKRIDIIMNEWKPLVVVSSSSENSCFHKRDISYFKYSRSKIISAINAQNHLWCTRCGDRVVSRCESQGVVYHGKGFFFTLFWNSVNFLMWLVSHDVHWARFDLTLIYILCTHKSIVYTDGFAKAAHWVSNIFIFFTL